MTKAEHTMDRLRAVIKTATELDLTHEVLYRVELDELEAFADEVRRECANRAVAWQVKLCADDDWACERCTECNQLRYAIMGKEAKE